MGEISQDLLLSGCIAFVLLGAAIFYLAKSSSRSRHQNVKNKNIEKEDVKVVLPEKTTTSVAAEQVTPQKDLKEALAKTKANLFGRLKESLVGKSTLSDDDMEVLEEVLYTSDMGPKTVQRLMGAVGEKLEASEKRELSSVQSAIKSEMVSIFSSVVQGEVAVEDLITSLGLESGNKGTKVWMVVGVNGAGKTTSIGKLAFHAAKNGLKVLVAAGDTFRAAAGEQLKTWTDRAQVEIFFPENVTDPSAVAFDACQKGVAGQFDLVIVDTAGRLHTQDNLMEELKKMKRVIQKVLPEAPHQTLIVLDANSGQNALIQAKNFNQALDLSGAILTKLDGTAKGGVAVGLACELSLPIRAIGVGEGIEDLRAFESQEFVDSII